jgi:dCMP deaminase
MRFLQLARHISTWSKDPSTQSGAVIVRPDGSVCSIGFNGFPQKMRDDPELYADRDTKYSRTVHSEINAHIFAGEKVVGYTLYTWPFSCCDRCAVQMIQAGISRFVFPELPPDKKERWGLSMDIRARQYFEEAGVEHIEVPWKDIPKLVLE